MTTELNRHLMPVRGTGGGPAVVTRRRGRAQLLVLRDNDWQMVAEWPSQIPTCACQVSTGTIVTTWDGKLSHVTEAGKVVRAKMSERDSFMSCDRTATGGFVAVGFRGRLYFGDADPGQCQLHTLEQLDVPRPRRNINGVRAFESGLLLLGQLGLCVRLNDVTSSVTVLQISESLTGEFFLEDAFETGESLWTFGGRNGWPVIVEWREDRVVACTAIDATPSESVYVSCDQGEIVVGLRKTVRDLAKNWVCELPLADGRVRGIVPHDDGAVIFTTTRDVFSVRKGVVTHLPPLPW